MYQPQDRYIPLVYLDDNQRERNSPCLIKLNKFINLFSLLVSIYLISNTVLLKFKYLDYISVDDKILYSLFGIGILYFISSLSSFGNRNRINIKSCYLYLLCLSVIAEMAYGSALYKKEPELFQNLELKYFLLSLGFFHLIYLSVMIFLKYKMQ